MYKKLSIQITRKLIDSKIIPIDDAEIYHYSFEVMISTFVSLLTILVWAIIFKQLHNALYFLVGFFICRTISGGYHADTHKNCFILTQLIFVSFLCFVTFIDISNIKLILCIIMIFSNLIILLIAPIDNKNKKFSENEYQRYKKKSKVFVLISTVMLPFLCLNDFIAEKSFYFCLGVFSVSIMLIFGKAKNIIEFKNDERSLLE